MVGTAATTSDTASPTTTSTAHPGRSSTLTGTWTLVRFVLRRDRLRLPLWVGGIVAVVLVSVGSIQGLYPTQADLVAAAAPLYDNAAVIVLNGPTHGIDTLGGRIVYEIGSFGYVVVALMGMFLVGRHTRADEETERTELLRATVLGRNAPLAAVLVVAVGAFAVLGTLVALSTLTAEVPVAGAVAYGAAMGAFGLFFACVTSVTVQITEHNRAALGLAGAVLGAAYVGRAVGDIGSGTISWLSPMGWAQAARPFADERWWTLLLLIGGSLVLAGAAAALLSIRDLGGGLVPPRAGRAEGSPWLGTPLGLAVRLQRATVVSWTAGLAFAGVAYGSIGEDVEDIIGDDDTFADIIAQAGGDLVDSYFSTALLLIALIAGGLAVSSTLRLRSEETSDRAEPLIAAAVPRAGWAASHLVVALLGSVLVMLVAGTAMGVTHGMIADDTGAAADIALSAGRAGLVVWLASAVASRSGWVRSTGRRAVVVTGLVAAAAVLTLAVAVGLVADNVDQVGRLTGAALGFVPALWVLIGVAFALHGLAPRAVTATWAVLVGCFVVGLLGQMLELPQAVMNLSPFQHVPAMPADGLDIAPLAVLTAVAAGLVAAGFLGIRRRDIGY